LLTITKEKGHCMARKFKNKLCYLCGNTIIANEDGDRDHIPPKSIFPTQIDGNLITVPTHKKCNNALSFYDEIFKAYLAIMCYDNKVACKMWKNIVSKSLNHPDGKYKKLHLQDRLRDSVTDDKGVFHKGPMLLISEDDPALMPQFERFTKGLYYHKFKKLLASTTHFSIDPCDLSDMENKFQMKFNWKTICTDVFSFFIYTTFNDDANTTFNDDANTTFNDDANATLNDDANATFNDDASGMVGLRFYNKLDIFCSFENKQ
jgi:hypothetical protein